MKIVFTGDYYPFKELTRYCLQKNISSHLIFGDLLEYINQSDLSGINIEFPLTSYDIPNNRKIGPVLKGDSIACVPVANAGFNMAYIANNHILDYGQKGMEDTIDTLTKVDINVVGVGQNRREARIPFFYTKDNVTVAVLNFAENEFNIASEDGPGANPLNIIDNVNDIKKAKEKAEYVFVVVHGGQDFNHYPPSYLIKQFRFYAENGASAIVCHHSHYIAGYEEYKGVPIFYGLGNVIYPKKVENERNKTIVPIFNITNERGLEYEYKLFFFDFNSMQLKLAEGTKYDFTKQFLDLSSLISCDMKKNEECWYERLSEEELYRYIVLIYGFPHWVFRILKKMRLLKILAVTPKIYRKRTLILWNLIRRETHREALLKIFEQNAYGE